MTTGRDALSLLAYPVSEELLGTVHIYEFPPDIEDAWADVLDDYRDITGSKGNLPYAGLATALRAAGHTSVNLHPTSRNAPPRRMITRDPLDPGDIHDAATVWHQALLRVPDDEISFGYPSELADLIAKTKPDPAPLGEHIRHIGGQPDAAGWVYDAATWEAAQRLAATAWTVDGLEIPLRADTSGNLMVWDTDLLWTGQWKGHDRLHYAALRLQLYMKTLPGMVHPVIVVDPSVSRLTQWFHSARSAWLAQNDSQAPLLALAIEGSGAKTRIERTTEIALTVWSKLRGEAAVLPEHRDLSGLPGRLRALVPKSVRFPIGRGVGMHTIRALETHVAATLGLPALTAHNVAGHQFSKAARRNTAAGADKGRDTELLDPSELPAIITASGCDKVRILVLYREQHTRSRMQRLLAYHFGQPDLADHGITEDVPVALADSVEVIFHHAADLLTHGDQDRTVLLGDIPFLDAPPGTRVAALCETEYDARQWAQQRKQARRNTSQVSDPDLIDAKPRVNRLLAEHNILAQFLATKPASTATSESAEPLKRLAELLKNDHAGHNAVADLLRSAGLVHPRLGHALAHGRRGIDEPLAYVGLHVREQRGPGKYGPRRLAWSLVALTPQGREWPGGTQWRVQAYQAKRHPRGGTSGWQTYTSANTAFRANPLPEGKRHDSTLAESVETALGQLQDYLGSARGYVLFVAGDSTRSLWPLLANKNLGLSPDSAGTVDGKVALPGFSPSCGHRPRAVVRVTSGSRDLPRPVCVRTLKINDGEQTERVTKTTRGLYQLDDAANTWILANVPPQFDGHGIHSRAGSDRTRWKATDDQTPHNWHAHTATEILVVGADDDPLRYAIAAARLCDHAIAWDGRTRYPAPVHLAAQMDRNHPDYRRTIDIDDELELEELADPDPDEPQQDIDAITDTSADASPTHASRPDTATSQ